MAENGKEAIGLFDGRDIDLLITDLNMPIMDGIELVKSVRLLPKYMFIPIIMLTTERNPEKRQLAEDVKVTTWVQKPFDAERFVKIIEKCLK
jgi:two-component system chemotaxis response regulator CheY